MTPAASKPVLSINISQDNGIIRPKPSTESENMCLAEQGVNGKSGKGPGHCVVAAEH